MTKLSLCLIVRDEAQRLPRCLASAGAVVDEIVVVDTGSRDGTVAVAERLGAQVERFRWQDDFAAARNASLRAATGDWALVLDADEELLEPATARERLVAFARAADGAVGRVHVENVAGDAPGAATDAVQSVVSIARFLPLGRGILFTGRIHEGLARAGAPALPARSTGVRVRHTGYTASDVAAKAKIERNVALCERALADDPTDSYVAWQLGRALALAERHADALGAFERALSHCPRGAVWGPPLIEGAASSLRALDRSEQALGLVRELATDVPDRPDTLFLAALCSMDLGDLGRAEAGFRRCLELGPSAPSAVESSPSAATWAPAHNLGVLCECLGRSDEARGWYRRALGFQPGHAPSQAGLERLGTA